MRAGATGNSSMRLISLDDFLLMEFVTWTGVQPRSNQSIEACRGEVLDAQDLFLIVAAIRPIRKRRGTAD